jgi:outer membrane immunogenic protein
MNGRLITAIVLLALTSSALAVEESGFYTGLTLQRWAVDLDEFGDVDLDSIGILAGYRINRHLGVEATYAIGIGDDSVRFEENGTIIPVKLELDRYIAAFVVGHLPVTDAMTVFARAGYGSVKAKATVAFNGVQASASETDSNFAWGFGAQFDRDRMGLRLAFDRPDSDTNSFSVLGLYRF